MPTKEETKRAAELKRTRRQGQLTKALTSQERLERTEEELNFYKGRLRERLLSPVSDNDKVTRSAEIDRLLKRLVELRARLALGTLQAKHEGRSLNDETRARVLTSFYRDCHELAAALSPSH